MVRLEAFHEVCARRSSCPPARCARRHADVERLLAEAPNCEASPSSVAADDGSRGRRPSSRRNDRVACRGARVGLRGVPAVARCATAIRPSPCAAGAGFMSGCLRSAAGASRPVETCPQGALSVGRGYGRPGIQDPAGPKLPGNRAGSRLGSDGLPVPSRAQWLRSIPHPRGRRRSVKCRTVPTLPCWCSAADAAVQALAAIVGAALPRRAAPPPRPPARAPGSGKSTSRAAASGGWRPTCPGSTASWMPSPGTPTANENRPRRTGGVGHAETVQVRYGPREISLDEVLIYFFRIIDPPA